MNKVLFIIIIIIIYIIIIIIIIIALRSDRFPWAKGSDHLIGKEQLS